MEGGSNFEGFIVDPEEVKAYLKQEGGQDFTPEYWAHKVEMCKQESMNKLVEFAQSKLQPYIDEFKELGFKLSYIVAEYGGQGVMIRDQAYDDLFRQMTRLMNFVYAVWSEIYKLQKDFDSNPTPEFLKLVEKINFYFEVYADFDRIRNPDNEMFRWGLEHAMFELDSYTEPLEVFDELVQDMERREVFTDPEVADLAEDIQKHDAYYGDLNYVEEEFGDGDLDHIEEEFGGDTYM